MRSISEIDRDFAGMKDNCQRQAHGCTFPACACSRKGAVPIRKQGEPAKVFAQRKAASGVKEGPTT